MLLSSIFVWIFIAVSLLLCYAWAEAYEYNLSAGVREVFGTAVLSSVGAGIPLALFLRQVSPRIILRKVKTLSVPQEEVAESFHALAMTMGVPSAELRLSETKVPLSVALQVEKPTVVMSESLVSLLNKDELEAVMAHEIAHIKNSDTTLKAVVTAYRTTLPHDPIIRLVEAAFHRERELAADETAVKVTKKPLSLASALLKIYEAFPKNKLASHGTFSILGATSTIMSRHPPILRRVNRLINLADSLSS